MKKSINNLKNKFYYSLESIKNRYPCKILSIKYENDFNKNIIITYQAVSKLNIRHTSLKEIVNDAMLVEKFHPTDCIKLGFLSAQELILKKSSNLEEAKKLSRNITVKMFSDN